MNLVRSHAAGVGRLLPERETRAMMLLRANVIAKGYSGARAVLADTLVAMLNAGLHPPIPEQGSVGASGDLAPLAHLALKPRLLVVQPEVHAARVLPRRHEARQRDAVISSKFAA